MQSNKNIDNANALSKRLGLWAPFLYFFILLLASIYSFKKPEYNWDMLAYMAIVVKADITNVDSIHQSVYNAAKKEMPPSSYQNLIMPAIAYRKEMSENAVAFYNQLPFYVVKPLYTTLIYLFYKSGFSLTSATVLPSVVSFLLMGVLLFYWLKKYLSIFFASALSTFVMLSPPMLSVARLSTPDALSALLLLSSFYFVLEKPKMTAMFILMIASIFARLDNIIICIAILTLIVSSDKLAKKISFPKYFLMLFAVTLCYLSISFSARKYGWSMLYYNSFAHFISSTHGFYTTFSLKDYLNLMYSTAINSLYHSYFFIFLGFTLSLFISRTRFSLRDMNIDQIFSLLFILIILIRFILYPDISDRAYIPFYLMIVIMLVRKMTNKESFVSQKNE